MIPRFQISAVAILLTCFAGTAHAGTVVIGSDEYFLTQTAESWSAAEAEAVADGGFLASVHSLAADLILAENFVNPNGDEGVPVWLGLYDPTTGDGGGSQHLNDFVWADGTAVDFTNWNDGEPNNANSVEYYTAIGWYSALNNSDAATWNDTPLNGSTGYGGNSDGPYYGVIEVALPEPASFMLMGAAIPALLLGRMRSGARR